MADIADIAEFFIPEVNVEEISKQFKLPSNTHCEECEEEIPEARRSIGGVKLCIDCKNDMERRKR